MVTTDEAVSGRDGDYLELHSMGRLEESWNIPSNDEFNNVLLRRTASTPDLIQNV